MNAYTPADFEAVIEAISTGKIKPRGLITKLLPLEDVEKGLKALVEDKDNQVKILIRV